MLPSFYFVILGTYNLPVSFMSPHGYEPVLIGDAQMF
jgi:hypothetical protein